jgi:GT2 family glycosyltransferase
LQHHPAPLVSIIVVNYNTRAMTQACLDSVCAQTRTIPCELILVDNDSRDGSVAALGGHPAVTKLIALGTNVGFARANNIAARHTRGRYILLLNPDTLVRDRAIERLVSFATCCPEARIWGGRTLFADGRLNPASCWGRITVWNQFCRAAGLTGLFSNSEVFNGEAYGGWLRDDVRTVDIVSGCFFLIERALWNQLDGFDTRFFMYGEDADLCLRARDFGACPMITPDATIVHYGGASERTRADKMVKLLAAKATLIDRHLPARTKTIARLLLQAWPLSRWLALAAARAIATTNAEPTEAARNWREIWRRRADWSGGFDVADPSLPETATEHRPAALASIPN